MSRKADLNNFSAANKVDKSKHNEQNSNEKSNPFSRILNIIDLKDFSFDADSKLILGLILLLSSCESDELLILALVYIMI